MIKEAAHYRKLDENTVICDLCPAECRLSPGKVGICGCRSNEKGRLVTDNYGELVTLAVDPIEKKPLYHFYPSSQILSTGANGCNFACLNCQNWNISQEKVTTTYLSPERLVERAQESDSIGVAFTYTEPMIWYEYLMDTAPLLKKAGLKVVMVSNGYINKEPLESLLPLIDAVNVDLKGIRPEFYSRICKGKLQPVLDNIEIIARSSVHLEITNLLIPGRNDSDHDVRNLVSFISGISKLIPLHISAFHTDYKLDVESTPPQTMLRADSIAREQLSYVYLGNISIEGKSDTSCPGCGRLLIKRRSYSTEVLDLKEGKCQQCGYETQIIQ